MCLFFYHGLHRFSQIFLTQSIVNYFERSVLSHFKVSTCLFVYFFTTDYTDFLIQSIVNYFERSVLSHFKESMCLCVYFFTTDYTDLHRFLIQSIVSYFQRSVYTISKNLYAYVFKINFCTTFALCQK